MAEWWESDPVVETATAPTDEGDWWKNDPVADQSQGQALHDYDPSKGERWNADQLTLANEAQAAGLPPAKTGWDRLVDAIDRAHKSGYKFAHFAGTDYDPTGDRSVSIDIENLSKVLSQKEDAERQAGQIQQADATAKERTYWEAQAGQGMTAEQWKAQTGQDDPALPPNGPGGVSASLNNGSEPAEIAQAKAQQAMERDATGGAPQWAKNAAGGFVGSAKKFIPESIRNDPMGLVTLGPSSVDQLRDVAGMFSPANSSIDEVIKAARIAKDVAAGVTPEEATRRHAPESLYLADAEKTAPYSKERFEAGFDTVAQMLMAKGIAKGHAKAGEEVPPQSGRPPTKTDEIANYLRRESPAPKPQIESTDLAQVLDENEPSIEIVKDEAASAPTRQAEPLPTEQNLTDSRTRGAIDGEPEFHDALPAEEHQRQHEEQIRSEANAAQAENGNELLQAIAKSGGLPAKNSPRLEEYRGELSDLQEAALNPHRKERIQYNKIFRQDAPSVDELATRLRDQGFSVETPNALFDLVSQRLSTERPLYGTPALAESLHGEASDRFLPHARERGAVLVPDINLPEGVTEVTKNVGEAGKAFFGPSKFTPFREVLNKWVGGRQLATLRGAKILRAINREVPNKARQRGITIFREAGGSLDLVRSQLAAAKTDWFRNAAKEALRLTPEEVRTAEKLDEWYDRKGRRALDHGAIRSMRENYANHIWNRPEKIARTFPQADSGGGKLNPSFRPGKERVLPTLFDGDQLRLKPKTIAAGELAAIYNHSLERALADRHFVSDLVGTTTPEGKPLAISQQDAARLTKAGDESFGDYKPVRHWAFRGEDYRGDILVHPKHAKHVEAAIRPSTIDRPEAAATPAGALARRAVRGTLRVSGLVKQNMLSLPGFHYVQEGTEALGHFVNPLSVERIDPANPIHRDAMNHGLMVASTHGGEAQWMEGLQTNKALITKVPVVGPAMRNASHYLFEHYIPSLKMQTYKAALNRNIKRFGKELESGKMTLDDVKYHTARQVNDAYGHLNYADMGRSENMQKLTRLLLLAPDFLEARARQAASGVAGLVPGQSWRVHAEQRVAFWTLAAGFYIGARALNQYLNGNPDWRLSHAFSVTHNGREYTMRSVPEDVLRFLTDTRRFALARLNPLTLRTGLEAATGLNYRGEKVTASEQLRDLLSQIIPLGLKDAAARLPGLEKTGNEDVSLLENLVKSFGVGIKRASPVIDAHTVARDWMKSKGMPADTGTYPSSPYARLRNALEDSNTDAARSAYQALLRDKVAPDIIKGFRHSLTKPFTKNETTDKAMLRELSPDDRAIIIRAQQARKAILQRFGSLRQSAVAHVMEQEAAKRHTQRAGAPWNP